MKIASLTAVVLGTLLALTSSQRRDERGLSQSAETAILLAGAVAVATTIVIGITAFVKAKLPK